MLHWIRISHTTRGSRVVDLTAACCEDGIGVIVSWTRREGEWRITGWGCTEDHHGQDLVNAEPLPDAPPDLLVRVLEEGDLHGLGETPALRRLLRGQR